MNRQTTGVQGEQFRAALAAAIRLSELSPVVPYAAGTDRRAEWTVIGARLHMYLPEDVRQAAAALGITATTEPVCDGTDVVARGAYNGIPFRVWSTFPDAGLADPGRVSFEVDLSATPAAHLGDHALEHMPIAERAEVVNARLLRLDVRPTTMQDWRDCLAEFSVPYYTLGGLGSAVTGEGTYDGVTVLLAGLGVGDLYAASLADTTPAPAVDVETPSAVSA